MTIFVVANWFLCLLTSGLLAVILLRHRFLFVKPSFIVISFFHVILQWPATVRAAEIESYLPDPYAFAILAHGFPLLGLVVSFFLARKDAYTVWQRITRSQKILARIHKRAIWLLTGSIVVIMISYLSVVPFSQTGLYAMLFDPINAALARERALKLLDHPLVQYLYHFMASVFAPLLAVVLSGILIRSYRSMRLISMLITIVAIGGVLLVASLSGARSFAAMILATVFFAFWMRRGMPVSVVYIVSAGAIILSIPTLFTLLREAQELNLGNIIDYYSAVAGERIFLTPMMVGLYHVHYAQTVSFIGIGGIPKLAALLGEEAVNVPNLIGVTYLGSRLTSISAGASYVFSYYSYFGMLSFPISLIGLWLLDIALWFYKRLTDDLLLPCVASVSIASLAFIQADYTVAWLTHGLGVLLILTFVLDRLYRIRV